MKRLVWIFAALLLLSGCTLRNRMPSELAVPSVIPSDTRPAPTASTLRPTVAVDQSAAPVKEVYSRSGTYTDYNNLTRSYVYRIPYVDFSSTDALHANNEIESIFRTSAATQEQLMDAGEAITVMQIDYSECTNGNILTLLVWQTTESGDTSYAVYNLDTQSGEKVSGESLIRQAGLTEEEFLQQVHDKLSAWFITSYYGYENTDSLLYATRYQQTVSEDNYGLDMPIFLDENGELNVIGTIYTFYGSGTMTLRIRLTG